MSTASVQMFSDSLGKWIRYNVILPDVGKGPFPVLFQLHGLSDDCDAWIQRSNIVRHVAHLPLVVVLPDGGTSCYLNWKSGTVPTEGWTRDRLHRALWEDCLMKDIADHVIRHFPVTTGPWAIGGLSMGGGGSMRLGLKYADRFKSIYSHSSKFVWDGQVDPERLIDAEDADIHVHARRVSELPEADRPVVSFDCGTEDGLLQENNEFDAFLTEIGVEHTYQTFPGDHEWSFWDEHVQDALKQHCDVLGIKPIDPWAKEESDGPIAV